MQLVAVSRYSPSTHTKSANPSIQYTLLRIRNPFSEEIGAVDTPLDAPIAGIRYRGMLAAGMCNWGIPTAGVVASNRRWRIPIVGICNWGMLMRGMCNWGIQFCQCIGLQLVYHIIPMK